MVDVGCGIGGSSRHIARKFGCTAKGITLSPVQVGLNLTWLVEPRAFVAEVSWLAIIDSPQHSLCCRQGNELICCTVKTLLRPANSMSRGPHRAILSQLRYLAEQDSQAPAPSIPCCTPLAAPSTLLSSMAGRTVSPASPICPHAVLAQACSKGSLHLSLHRQHSLAACTLVGCLDHGTHEFLTGRRPMSLKGSAGC